jgi:hypothetical protein
MPIGQFREEWRVRRGLSPLSSSLGGIVVGQTYLLRDEFSVDLVAGAVNGTLAEPGGIGSVAQNTRNVVDSAGTKLSITGGREVSSGITGTGDPRQYYGPFTRTPGLMATQTLRWVTARSGAGWAVATNPGGGTPFYGVTDVSGLPTVTPPFVALQMFATGADYTLWMVLFATGAAIWAQGGGGGFVYTTPTLIWVETQIGNATPAYYFPQLARAVDCQLQADDIAIWQSVYTTPASLAAVYIATPANGVNYTSGADALHYLDFALPGSPSAGDTIELRYRYQDATNYWTAYVKRDAGNAAWDFFLDKVTAGTPANQITVTGVGTPVRVMVKATGNTHDCFTGTAAAWTKRGATITDADFNTATEVGAWFGAGTPSLLHSYRRTWSAVTI